MIGKGLKHFQERKQDIYHYVFAPLLANSFLCISFDPLIQTHLKLFNALLDVISLFGAKMPYFEV